MSVVGRFAVGVSVLPVDVAPPTAWELADPEPWPVAATLVEMLPPRRTEADVVAVLGQITAAEAMLAGLRAQVVTEFAALRPDTWDRRPARPGAAADADEPAGAVSEFFADELALVLNCSRTEATTVTERSTTLIESLPATFAALAEGRLDWPRARAITAELGQPARGTDPAVIGAVEDAVLPHASGLSVRGVREAVRRELAARDAAASERRRRDAQRGADVRLRPVGDGMSELVATMPAELAAACRHVVDAAARAARSAGDERPLGMLRVGALGDLLLDPWDTERESVTAHLTVTAPLNALTPDRFLDQGAGLPSVFARPQAVAEPTGAVDGTPITAAHLRELLTQLDALCPGGLQAPPGGSLTLAITDPDGALLATTTRRELQRLVRRGCPTHGHTGCRCAVLDRPPATGAYSPTAAQRRWVQARDRTCRHPGCATRAGWSDLDHAVARSCGGATACENLCCLCRRHHRLKTFAPRWRHTLTPDGTLTVTTPSGVTRTSRPPGLRPPGLRLTGPRVLTGPPPPPPDPDDDPPPF
ncbi:HNH endonuclease signature motif containing protein [Geodermatophilus sabuli]|uniref:DUF222 domain-containing protein n=1 Tax=Geodermatophilus sabuli TaxID=1564158 RepID=A0A285E8A1_9ACTN|nr:HNH endonuclease signature motif containing protein [Geodermatophilus sabuli]MBB3081882.1 hypothetical protein [Geodermatophilus sabuli]SNX95245.1 protein of unknown function [Geodermatophilus sabuli]